MKFDDLLNEDGRIVKGVNTTVDVGVNQIPIETRKFNNEVTKNGLPPFLRTDGKTKQERFTAYEWAIISGGHSLHEQEEKPKLFDFDKY